MPIHAKTVFSAFGIAGIILLLLPSSARGALSVFQAETGVLTGVSIATRNFGFESAGYADYNDRGGGSIAWTYNAASSGDVKVTIRYATMNDRPLDLYIDGTKRAEFLCKNTGSWTSWTNEMAMLSLEGGAHTLLLQARLTGPNVDWLSVLSSEPEPNESPQTDIRSPAVVYQAETALLTKVTLETVNAGYDGSGYANYQGIGGFLLWSVTAPSTARYDVKAKYATVNERKCNLYIDNALVGTFSFRGTGAWNKWNEETIVVSLTQGVHQLKILAEDSSGPNIDRISVASSCGIECDFAPPPTPRDVPITPPPNIFAIPRIFSSRVVLASNQGLERGQFVSSPNGEFNVGLTFAGDFVLQRRNGDTVWSAGTAPNGFRLFIQSDGNAIVRRSNNQAVWTSETYNHAGAQLIVDDGGRIAVTEGNSAIWIQGIPRGTYTGPPAQSLDFPVRGMFYYPWFPETWTVNGKRVRFIPSLGLYSNSDPFIIQAHIDAFDYARVDLIICSWWGPDTNQDKGRITMIMDEIVKAGSNVKLSFYHEDERDQRPSPRQIKSDLDYLKKWFAWHPACAHVDNRPVIFVYNEAGCDVPARWMAASNREWYVVLKLFPGFQDCTIQPDHWHQYGVDNDPLNYRGYSTTIAPGFWRADLPTPLLPRLGKDKWCSNVNSMVQSNEPWQLIVSFNEHGEATGVESSPDWSSNTGYGFYLDCLHQNF